MKSYFNVAVLSVVSLISSHIATAFEIEYPKIRFTPYDELTADQQASASGLGYTEKTWNTPGSYDLEWNTWWYQMNTDYYDLDNNFAEYAEELGFPDQDGENDQWDCWSTHYNYEWKDIVKYKLDEALGVLGWNEELWTNDEVPESNDKSYMELSNAEKTAAGVLCYTKSLWDGDELSSFALDSPKVILVGKEDISRTCNWASKDLGRCKKTMKNHCCNTCGTCDEFKCVNTEGKFLWKKKKKEKLYENCGFLRGKSNKKLVKICEKKGMKETCPENCDPACKVVSV
mmetsp:Transcript_941/g.1046  ORF Transcript_941/g.1046 Transcript_941/m.1046 type:complete len:287 (-) Transcript_941:185-1045(-)